MRYWKRLREIWRWPMAKKSGVVNAEFLQQLKKKTDGEAKEVKNVL